MFTFLRQVNIRVRLLASFITIVEVPLIAITVLFSILSYVRIERLTVANQNDRLTYIQRNLELTLRVYLNTAAETATNRLLATIVSDYKVADDFEKGILKQRIYEFLGSRLSKTQEIVFIEIFDDSQRIVSVPYTIIGDFSDRVIADLRDSSANKYKALYIMDRRSNPQFRNAMPHPELANPLVIGVKILDSTFEHVIGYLTLTFNSEILDLTTAGWETRYIVSGDGRILYEFPKTEGKSGQRSGTMFVTDLYHNDFISELNMEAADWRIVSILHREKLLDDVRLLVTVSLLSLFVATGFVILLSNLVTRSITVPLYSLSGSMNQFKGGQLGIRTQEWGHDEITELSRDFNLMVQQLENLVQEVYLAQLNKQKEELRLLQAQMNPHFLYNTLDFVNWRAFNSDNQEICTIVQALSNFYRLSLNCGEEIYKVRDEIELIESYITIHRLRFPEMFDFFMEVDERSLDMSTLKLILQPLVENALVHGLAPLESKGTIRVRILTDGSSLTYEVEDNGVGGAIETFFCPTVTRNENHGFGISNINARIKMYFGASYGLSFRTTPGGGITAIVTLPVENGKYHNTGSNIKV